VCSRFYAKSRQFSPSSTSHCTRSAQAAATFTRLKSGFRRIRIRRKGKYVNNTFLRVKDSEEWALETERRIDRGEPTSGFRDSRTFGDIIRRHLAGGWVDMETDDVVTLISKFGSRRMSLESGFGSDSLNTAMVEPDSLCHRAPTPMRCASRLFDRGLLMTARFVYAFNGGLRDGRVLSHFKPSMPFIHGRSSLLHSMKSSNLACCWRKFRLAGLLVVSFKI